MCEDHHVVKSWSHMWLCLLTCKLLNANELIRGIFVKIKGVSCELTYKL